MNAYTPMLSADISRTVDALGERQDAAVAHQPVRYRFYQMLQLRRADLKVIIAKHPSQFERNHARRWLAVLNERAEAVAKSSGFHGDAVAQVALGRFGRNGWGPAIDMAAREARAVRA